MRPASLVLALFFAGCGGGGDAPVPTVTSVAIAVDGSAVTGTLHRLWRDHYDLSYVHASYAAEPGLVPLVQSLQPRSWRCSVGRWEVGYPPPPGGDSLDPAVLRTVEREFYVGANTLAAADDPANYDFAYLDAQLTALVGLGVEPFLCFDYMPFTLSSEQDPQNGNNYNVTQPGVPFASFSFSNGIRTAPPEDPAVYARVVRNTIRHVRGLFAGATDYGIRFVEIGNEPDLAGNPFFWTGTRAQFIAMYNAIATDVAGDAQIGALVRLGAASFAFPRGEPAPTFLQDFLADVAANGTRLEFLSFHTYADDPALHFERFAAVEGIAAALGLAPELINAEWGRALDGVDPVYDRIEHGLLRAKVMILMQLFGITHAHEAIIRDPGPGQDLLGLLRTGPPAHKPVSYCYQALGMLDATPDALQLSTPAGSLAIAGRNPAGTKVVVIVVGDEPGSGTETRFEVTLTNLPWGASGSFELRRHRVTGTTGGVALIDTQPLTGETLTSAVQVAPGGQGLFVWELTRS
ncbi:MAG: hypothetical protein ACYSUM_01765 [Planctomycetota bacterium]|jgi:hypothetical protein